MMPKPHPTPQILICLRRWPERGFSDVPQMIKTIVTKTLEAATCIWAWLFGIQWHTTKLQGLADMQARHNFPVLGPVPFLTPSISPGRQSHGGRSYSAKQA